MLRPIVLALTVLSGFTGLAYEVTWHKYLAILLGAHSEATAAVLGLFLGGLSLGYWLFGALTRRLVRRARTPDDGGRVTSLLAVYGAVEAGIGVWCLAFAWIFPLVRSASVALPGGEGALGFAIDILLAALLVVPPATLMGGTIPILTQALARDLSDATRIHAQIYAANTAGAFAGTLATGFVLIPSFGLEGTLHAMGAANLAIGAAFVVLGRRPRAVADLDAGATSALGAAAFAVYGGAALLVGFAMMVLQTIVIRIGGLTFGSSEYTFTIVVAVFVLCIAAGSFAVSALPRIGRGALSAALWALAILFTALYFGLETAPYWGHLLRVVFRDIDFAFYVFYAAVFLMILFAIGPAVAFSGAVLPLSFHALRREIGELGSQAGRLYSVNTVGSLLGALIGGYALLFWVDLHHVYRIALCALVLAAAIATLREFAPTRLAAAALLLGPLFAIAAMPAWRPDYLAAGLFREREPTPWTFEGPATLARYYTHTRRLLFHDDDPTATVSVHETEHGAVRAVSLVVNGKSDGNSYGDYGTMAMAAVVPALFAERAENAFVIGFGTGITAGELAALEESKSVTVAEISAAVIDAAPLFDFANHGAAHHPEVEVVHGDAYRALVRSGRHYDVIVSEPSNPWVTGVEMLFSQEFLTEARDHLTPRGVYCQWLQRYETTDEAMALVLRTYASVFDHVVVWTVNHADLLLLGFRDPHWALDLERLAKRLQQPDFGAASARLALDGLASLLVHETLPIGVLQAAALRGPVHSLYSPRLNFLAGRAFFVGGRGSLPFTGSGESAKIGSANSLLGRHLSQVPGDTATASLDAAAWRACRSQLANCGPLAAAWSNARVGSNHLDELTAALGDARGRDYVPQLRHLLDPRQPAPRRGPVPFDEALAWTRLYVDYYSHAEPFDPAALVDVWQRCDPGAESKELCAFGLKTAAQLASGRSPSMDWLKVAEASSRRGR